MGASDCLARTPHAPFGQGKRNYSLKPGPRLIVKISASVLRARERQQHPAAQHCEFQSPLKNAMNLDIAMGGSTNTVLHLLAAAVEGEVNFTMKDIDRLSRQSAASVQGLHPAHKFIIWKTCTVPVA